ncbi:helix-turn-helix transcriptional regulator [Nitratireductor luteus]|uniref:helix-turn-helix transcriptional regulator n=1 Tax=Nitratireductor luteus TaxID=2976980 RepID=UPI00223EAE9D|nr:response regulator transcription factor [Nitratireductor luteus]
MNKRALNLDDGLLLCLHQEKRTVEAKLYRGVKPADKRKERTACLLLMGSTRLRCEYLRRALISHEPGMDIVAVGSVTEWRDKEKTYPPLGAILLNVGEQNVMEGGIAKQIRELSADFHPVPVVVLADNEKLEQILMALEYGARGYIPASVGINVCIEAVALAMSGGTFIPASSVLAMRHLIDDKIKKAQLLHAIFTRREIGVVEALRQGKPNKIIAYELNIRESTVKVHIRNIMKKLKATNRTEVAYKLGELKQHLV